MELTVDKSNNEWIEVSNKAVSFKFKEVEEDAFTTGTNIDTDIVDLIDYIFTKAKDDNKLIIKIKEQINLDLFI